MCQENHDKSGKQRVGVRPIFNGNLPAAAEVIAAGPKTNGNEMDFEAVR